MDRYEMKDGRVIEIDFLSLTYDKIKAISDSDWQEIHDQIQLWLAHLKPHVDNAYKGSYRDWILEHRGEKLPETKYYLVKHVNCGATGLNPIMGLTTDEKKAKAMQSVFCDYEEVKFL